MRNIQHEKQEPYTRNQEPGTSLGYSALSSAILIVIALSGAPFFIASVIYMMFSNLGSRTPGEASAYTVFNEGLEALPGQVSKAVGCVQCYAHSEILAEQLVRVVCAVLYLQCV